MLWLLGHVFRSITKIGQNELKANANLNKDFKGVKIVWFRDIVSNMHSARIRVYRLVALIFMDSRLTKPRLPGGWSHMLSLKEWISSCVQDDGRIVEKRRRRYTKKSQSTRKPFGFTKRKARRRRWKDSRYEGWYTMADEWRVHISRDIGKEHKVVVRKRWKEDSKWVL